MNNSVFSWDLIGKKLLAIPGMIEPAERKELYKTSFNLNDGACILEYGTFLGASAASLAAGVLASSKAKNCKLITIDGFVCPKNSDLANNILAYSNAIKANKYLVNEATTINWLPLSNKIVNSIVPKSCSTLGVELYSEYVTHSHINATYLPKKIDFLHLDMPKNWYLLYPILISNSNAIDIDTIICFQDYGFELSGTIIYAVNYLIENNYLKPTKIVASSLYCVVIKKLTNEVLHSIDYELRNNSQTVLLHALKFHEISKSFPEIREIEMISINLAACQLISQLSISQRESMNIISSILSKLLSKYPQHSKITVAKLSRILSSSMATTEPIKT